MPTEKIDVLRFVDSDPDELARLLLRFGLQLSRCNDGEAILGSYWGDEEAGLQGNCLYLRDDTPLHSILHEACHYICMDPTRRAKLDTNAGSDNAEENAVCYLQVLLADEINELGRERMFADMDTWGYSFRLGSSRAWFENDAEDALTWLISRNLIDSGQCSPPRLRQA
jgi:hypothetical protein